MTDQPSDGCSPLFTSDIGPDSLRIPTGFDETLVGHLARASHLVPAQALAQAGATGQRVAVVAPQGLEYVIGFLGALRAGAIAVPLFSPHMPGHEERLVSALRDAGPVCLLTTRRARTAVADFCTSRRLPGANRVLAIGGPYLAGLPQTGIDESESVRPRPEDCAYLQYASGSTRSPAGVEITHANAVANVRQALKAFEIDRDRNQIVSWLPLFHDMGLVLAIAIPVVAAVHSVITDPLAFVQHPARWLRLLADHPRAVTAAPNFAYDYCVRRVHESARDGLRLDHVSVMINGSEPVRPGTPSRFEQAFAPTGRHDGCLYVKGRIKDLIIIDGTNHYPQDIEVTVQEAHETIRHDRLVVVAEHSRRLTDPRVVRDAVARAVRGAVAMGHGTAPHDFVLARPGTVPRTSSGKVARTACRARYLAGVWASSIESDLTGAGEGE